MIHSKKNLKVVIDKALTELGLVSVEYNIERPAVFSHGDFSTNVALVCAKNAHSNPRDLAYKITDILIRDVALAGEKVPGNDIAYIEKIEVAGPGFINIRFSQEYFRDYVGQIIGLGNQYGVNNSLKEKKIIVEYTDPNAFKVFHIGHLMSNAIGESIARLLEANGANVIRMCYPSDVGLHIAKAVWAIVNTKVGSMPTENEPLSARTDFLGKAYVYGTEAYEKDEEGVIKKEIEDINQIIFSKSGDQDILDIYEQGRKWSFEHLDEIYKILGTEFNEFIYESEVAEAGKTIVQSFVGSVFHESEGAIVFKGEDHGLHTRVFINSKGLPIYEAKEIALNIEKFKRHPDINTSIIITASEQNDYFSVLLKALEEIDIKQGTAIASKTKHIGHGMLRLSTGKMSSRKGNVITGESLIHDVKEIAAEKIATRGFEKDVADRITDIIAIGAIKYSILKSGAGSGIIFDFDKSLSFEGDSGPYIQYTHTRALSVLAKADEVGIVAGVHTRKVDEEVSELEKMILMFPERVERACKEYAPNVIALYAVELAFAFNAYYAQNQIVNDTPEAPYRVALTKATATILNTALNILGIKVPEKM